MNVLVVDIGGSHVKLCVSGVEEVRRFDSGPDLTPRALMAHVREMTGDWTYNAVAVGYPGRVDAHGPVAEPGNLGSGWVGFDFAAAFERPVRIVNDAALQALGAYDGGRMLFLGLGTGLGSVLVAERVIIPLELGGLRGPAIEDMDTLGILLGKRGLERLGERRWAEIVREEAVKLREAFVADYVMLGGGNASIVDPLPEHARRGGNEDACAGGIRLWEEVVEPHDQQPREVWRVVAA
jgi:polyphosphate glucokinase